MVSGSCLCQGVRYEIAGPLGKAAYCHCSRCRKWSGSALLGYAGAAKRHFRWTLGEDLLGRFPSSERVFRVFCSRCGSALVAWPSDPAAESLWVMIAAVILAVGVMMVFAESVSRFVEKHPTVKMLALSFLLLIGVMLVAEGIGTHVNKGYIYFAMAFSLLVEFLNLRAKARAELRKKHAPNK